MKKALNTTKLLLALSADYFSDAVNPLYGTRGIYIAAKKLNMGKYQAKTALQSLEKSGYIKKAEDGLLITPKGKRRVKRARSTSLSEKWDGKWRLVIYDIPEKLRDARDALRYFLQAHHFIRLQNSVFVSPQADFTELDQIRRAYNVEKYVNFLEAQSVHQDNDSRLRERFNLS